MRVSGKPGGVGSTQSVSGSRPSATPAATPVAPASASDAVQVSSAARLVAVAQQALAVVPDIRMDKVEAIKTQLDANDYHPDGEAVAEGLIKEHLATGRHS
jgi:negative regulator of flagellin synthesis FlgM